MVCQKLRLGAVFHVLTGLYFAINTGVAKEGHMVAITPSPLLIGELKKELRIDLHITYPYPC